MPTFTISEIIDIFFQDNQVVYCHSFDDAYSYIDIEKEDLLAQAGYDTTIGKDGELYEIGPDGELTPAGNFIDLNQTNVLSSFMKNYNKSGSKKAA